MYLISVLLGQKYKTHKTQSKLILSHNSELLKYPTKVAKQIEETLSELGFLYKQLKVTYNKRVLIYYFRLLNNDGIRLINLSGYFATNKIESARIDLVSQGIYKIEALYNSQAIIYFNDVISPAFLNHRTEKLVFFGKNGHDIVVAKLSDLVVFGKPGSGKTNFLHQICKSLHNYAITWIHPEQTSVNVSDGLIIADNFHLLPDDLQKTLLELKTSNTLHLIIATDYVYDPAIKTRFMNKVVFKLCDSREKQFIMSKNLSHDSLADVGDFYYIQGQQVFRVQGGLV
jgi:hypothetical protein